MLVLLGLLLVLAGAFGAIIGLLGAIGSGLHLRLLPARQVTPIGTLAGGPAPSAHSEPGPRVVVRGRAAAGPGGTYRAPLSDRDCVWFLVTQTPGAAQGGPASTGGSGPPAADGPLERFSAEPFQLLDAKGHPVLIGPRCPALEMAPSFREECTGRHPWFGAAGDPPDGSDSTASASTVLEFIVTSGTDLLAAGDLGATPDGTPTLGGEVTLSAAGDVAAAGDPARRSLRRDLALAVGGLVLVGLGSVALTVGHSASCDARATALCPAGQACNPC